ncbi:hypothetical protein GCM10023159_25850 [Brevibacterium yomogidense]
MAGIARVELRGLQLDRHVAKLFDVEEQQVHEEIIAVDVDVQLTSDERETGAELVEGVDDAVDQPLFKFSLGYVAVDCEEVERVGVSGDLLREFGIWLLECAVEVR